MDYFFDDDGELVTSDTADVVVLSQHVGQAGRCLLQQQVSCFMAKRIIDDLEIIEIQKQESFTNL